MGRFRDLNDKAGHQKRGVSEDERSLWHAAMKETKALDRSGMAVPPTPPKIDKVATQRAVQAAASDFDIAGQSPSPRPSSPSASVMSNGQNALVPGKLDNLDRRNADRLRRGEMQIERQIDLHGMTQDAAQKVLNRFIADCHAQGVRCVLVITGKGRRAGDETGESNGRADSWMTPRGVLKDAVPNWLSQNPNRSRIVAVSPAIPRHGGTGALYVLLKRHRD